MTRSVMTAAFPVEVAVSGGVLYGYRHGSAWGDLAMCLPGLACNSRSFDVVAGTLAGADYRAVAIDPRGRGRSTASPSGTYGWGAHARDAIDVADAHGARAFDVIGHSMGAHVAIALARRHPSRVRRVVLVDAVARPEEHAMAPVRAMVDALDRVYPDMDTYVARVRNTGLIDPWDDTWERHFRYDLSHVPGGVRRRSAKHAVREDLEHADANDASAWWSALACEVLLVRATRASNGGHFVPEAQRDAFSKAVPHAKIVEVDATHYTIITHPETAAAVKRFLS